MEGIVFKEWAPDQPDMGAEYLITARNVIPSPAGYKPFKTFLAGSATAPTSSCGLAYAANSPNTKGTQYVYANFGDIYLSANLGTFTNKGGSTLGALAFAQFDDLIIAVGAGDYPYKHTIGATSSFSTLASSGTAPVANCVGVINRFVVVGDILTTTAGSTARSNVIRWSAIDQPTNWPTPNSATAIATQAGEQIMPSRYGQVQAIHGGDQFGLIFQGGAVSRMTYEGPPTVFRFDEIDNVNGSIFSRGSIQVGGLTYFISRNGFCRTNGVEVERIGLGKVDRFFWDSVYMPSAGYVNAGYDPLNNLVQWAYVTTATSSATCDRMISFNPDTSWWSYSDIALQAIVTPNKAQRNQETMIAISSTFLGTFSGTAGSAVIETSDAEFNPGGRSWVSGVKPNVESTATAPSIGVRIGYRDDLGTTPSYTSTTSPTAATGFADCRVDAKYVRVELNLTGNFDKVTGFVPDAMPSSDR